MMENERKAKPEERAYVRQIKEIRAQRGPTSKEHLDRAKEQNQVQKAVLKAIETEAKTVPEISQETGIASEKVFWWITALRKYDRVLDVKKRDGYMTYKKR